MFNCQRLHLGLRLINVSERGYCSSNALTVVFECTYWSTMVYYIIKIMGYFCSSILNIQVRLSNRIIRSTSSFYNHVFTRRRQQVRCQFIHRQSYRIPSYLLNMHDFKDLYTGLVCVLWATLQIIETMFFCRTYNWCKWIQAAVPKIQSHIKHEEISVYYTLFENAYFLYQYWTHVFHSKRVTYYLALKLHPNSSLHTQSAMFAIKIMI